VLLDYTDRSKATQYARELFKTQDGWLSTGEIYRRINQKFQQVFSGQLPGLISSVARYSYGKYGWKNYITNNMHELNAQIREHAHFGLPDEQAFALFEAFKHKYTVGENTQDVWITEKDPVLENAQIHWYHSSVSGISFMEIQSRKNSNQYLLFIVLEKIPAKSTENQEDSVLLLRSMLPFNLQLPENQHKLQQVAMLRDIAQDAYKNRLENPRVELTISKPLAIHKAAQGRVWLDEELMVKRGLAGIPDKIIQNDILHLEIAVQEAFRECCNTSLQVIQKLSKNKFSLEECQDDLWVAITGAWAESDMSSILGKYFEVSFQDTQQLNNYIAVNYFCKQAKELLTKAHALAADGSMLQLIDNAIDERKKQIAANPGMANINKYFLDFLQRVKNKLQNIEKKNIPQGSIVFTYDISDFRMQELRLSGQTHGIVDVSGLADNAHAPSDAKALQYPFFITTEQILQYIDLADHERPADEIIFYGTRIIINPTPEDKTDLFSACQNDGSRVLIERFQKSQGPVKLKYQVDGQEIECPIELRINYFDNFDEKNINSREIGLVRMEVIHGQEKIIPAYVEWQKIMAKMAKKFPRGITFRTLDVNRYDKTPESIGLPAMSEKETLTEYVFSHPEARGANEDYIRAILHTAQHNPDVPIRIMFPMISTRQELEQYLDFLAVIKTEYAYSSVQVPGGVMIETGGAVFALKTILEAVDFISIGTNDLTMTVLGEKSRQDTLKGLEPNVLQALRQVIVTANSLNMPVEVCGNMASNPLLACILLSLGWFAASMENTSIPFVRDALEYMREHDLQAKILELIEQTASQNYARELYAKVLELFAEDKALYNFLRENYPPS
jgi:phosphotransferase system enzyme I (PtsI)